MSELADYLQSHPEHLWALSESDDLKEAAFKIIKRQDTVLDWARQEMKEAINYCVHLGIAQWLKANPK
jgi:hypothetical protein